MPAGSAQPRYIFDFGAVLFRWAPVDLMTEVLPRHAPDRQTAAVLVERFFQGFGGAWGRFDRGDIELPELTQVLMVQAGLEADEVRRVIDAVPASLTPMVDTLDWLARLRAAGHRLYYLSNMPAPYAEHLERSHDFLRWFRDGVFSARVRLGKPDEAIFRLALQRFGERAEDCIFLDDHPANVAVACQLGLKAVQFRDAAQAEADVAALG
jgi:HAD superfamily hydrolase (TIGR01509 family)